MLGMESDKICACKGKRTCLICESTPPFEKDVSQILKKCYIYCSECERAWYDQNEDNNNNKHPHHTGHSIDFPGVSIIHNFISPQEELDLVTEINKTPWTDSQSGRRKQDYGPKVNFKKKKLKTSAFTGLPAFSKYLVDRMNDDKLLSDFVPVEMCNLEYIPERGSAIDPHHDDFWLWGERLVTLNLLSGTNHTMTLDSKPDIEVIIPLPRYSLVIVQGSARHEWKHAVKRADITEKRLAVTFREFTPEFLEGGKNEAVGAEILRLAASFEGVAIGTNGNT